MDRQDFWFPAELESLGTPPTGTRAGQFLFLSGQTPRNPETGKVIRKLPDLPDDVVEGLRSWGVHGDGREGPINAQTWQVYQNLSQILESQGSSLEHIVRQRLYLTDWRDIRNAERVMQTFFPGEKPATTIARMTDNGYHDDYRIVVEVVAIVPEEGGLTTTAVHVPGLEKVCPPYPQGVRVGDLLFTSGLYGVDPETGRVPTRLSEVNDEGAAALTSGNYHIDISLEAFKAQMALVRSNSKRLLESQGASMTDMLRYNLCTSVGMVDVGVFVPLYAYDNPDPGTAPTITGFTMGAGRLSGDPDATAVMDSVAVVPGGEWEKVGKTYPEIVSGPIPMTQQAGPLIFLTGYSGRDQANFPIVTFDQLRDHGKLMGLAHYDDPESETMMCQAWHIYRTYQRLLKEAGSDISRVVHQVLYLVDVSKLGALERVARVIYDGKVPPTTVIGADEIGPYPELQLEIDVVAIPS